MRKFIVIVLVLAAIVGGVAAFLFATTPKQSAGIRFPLSANHRALVARVPASAEAFALIPTAAGLHAQLVANPVTREPLVEWSSQRQLPRPWMLGSADLLMWKSGKRLSYLVRLDPLRAALLRFYLLFTSGVDAEVEESAFLINVSNEAPIAESDLAPLLALAEGLPQGDALVVQRARGQGAFPPIARPAVSSLRVTAATIDLTSRAVSDDDQPARPIEARLPAAAMISGAFAEPPRFVGDLNRLFGAKVSDALANGGSVAVYDVNTGTLLPRPKGIVAIKADAETRAQMGDVVKVAELVGDVRDRDDEIILSLDDKSMGLYLKDRLEPSPWPANRWTLRLDPRILVPVLRKAGDSTGLRIALPRLSRSTRDLRRWMAYLENARVVEAADSIEAGVEVLRVRIE